MAKDESHRCFCISLESNSAAMPAPTLEFASICLQNALFLLPSPLAMAAAHGLSPIDNNDGGKEAGADLPCITALPGPPIKGDSILDLRLVYSSILRIPRIYRSCILACKAYVSLGLGDPVSALGAAQQLLDMSSLPGGLK